MTYQENEDSVFTTTVINGIKYRLIFYDNYTHWYVSLSSGKKRYELSIYEQKYQRSGNGFEVVKWAINALLEFPYKGRVVIYWADVRRRKIYGRFLLKHGFNLTRFDGNMCYMKKYV